MMVSVDVPEPVTEEGTNVPVAPTGKPVTVKATVPLKPFRAPTVIVLVMLLPVSTVSYVVEESSVKSAGALTISVAAVVWTRLPLVAVIVNG